MRADGDGALKEGVSAVNATEVRKLSKRNVCLLVEDYCTLTNSIVMLV